MLKVRVIPTLLYKSVGLVKGVGFNSWRRVDTVLPAIKVYNMREVDELILLDIEATNEKRDPDYDEIRDFSRECFVPFCVGGGICHIDQIKNLLRAGADKVAINSAAYDNLSLITEGAKLLARNVLWQVLTAVRLMESIIVFLTMARWIPAGFYRTGL